MEILEFTLFGAPKVVYKNQLLKFPERKGLALLCLLALEPIPQRREQIASLLWSDSTDERARGALRKVLVRLREILPNKEDEFLLFDRSTLALAHVHGSDWQRLRAAVQQPDSYSLSQLQALADLYQGQFLENLEFDNNDGFNQWLRLKREQALETQDRLLEHLAKRHAVQGNLEAAIQTTEQRLHLNNLNEDAYAGLLQLLLSAGKRVAVTETYNRYVQVMHDELSLTPSPEITVLAEQARGTTYKPTVLTLPKNPAPQTAKSAPDWSSLLVGRESEWQQLENAYARGLLIYIVGPPGIGKTRLMQEFAASKGSYWGQFNARPSDLGVPYAAYARSIRHLLERFADVRLEPWVQAELSRIIPEMSSESFSPNTLPPQESKLRLCHAIAEFYIAIAPQMTGMLIDDIQFFDQSSAEASLYLVSTWQQFGGDQANTQHFLTTFRTGEMPPGVEEGIRQQAAAGLAALIELQPLSEPALQKMLAAMPQKPDHALIDKIHHFTGGNPMFALETLKSLSNTKPNTLPVTTSVLELIQHRLERLSVPARNLARLAAVAGADFSLEVAVEIFQHDQLLQALEELETQHFFAGAAFVHDLLYEATLQATPKGVRQLLHGSLLRVMPQAHAVVRLRHALGAENPEAVLQHSLGAAQEALELVTSDVLKQLEQALVFLEQRQMQSQAAQVREELERLGKALSVT